MSVVLGFLFLLAVLLFTAGAIQMTLYCADKNPRGFYPAPIYLSATYIAGYLAFLY